MPPTTYEVRIAGLLSEDALAAIGEVHVATTGVSTVLSGELPDQAALLGLLTWLRNLGLDVVEVRRVLGAEEAAAEEMSPSADPSP
jgi:hypothetical protein